MHYLQEWREHFNLTKEQLGKMAGLTGSFIGQIERGTAGYTQNSVERLSRAMGIEPGDLISMDPENPRQDTGLRFPPGFWDKVTEEERPDIDFMTTLAKSMVVEFVVRYMEHTRLRNEIVHGQPSRGQRKKSPPEG